MLILATARVLYSTEYAIKPQKALDVTVIGHQFWWEYRYPASGVVMASPDTDHSFWVPRLAEKIDLIPNKVNVTTLILRRLRQQKAP